MHDLTVNKVRRNIDSEGEMEVPRALALLEYMVMGNAKSRILENGDVLSAQGTSRIANLGY